MKKLMISLLLIGMASMGIPATYAHGISEQQSNPVEVVSPIVDDEIEYNLNVVADQESPEFDDFIEQTILENNKGHVVGDKKVQGKQQRKRYGSWTWRDGVICVTDGGKGIGALNTWHAGIIAPQKNEAVAEANPGSGVRLIYGSWAGDRFKRNNVWQVGVKSTSVAQDWRAGYWAGQQEYKPYNWNFYDLSHTRDFYCSSLVYHAYRQTTGVNLNVNGGIMYPWEFLPSNNSKTDLIYSKK